MKTKKGFIILTTFLVLVIAFSIVGTVNSKEDRNHKVEENYYKQLEEEYVQKIREYLSEEGYKNSGVMLTRTVYEDGLREYQISIHISRLNKMSEEEKDMLIEKLKEKAFDDDNCSFVHSLS